MAATKSQKTKKPVKRSPSRAVRTKKPAELVEAVVPPVEIPPKKRRLPGIFDRKTIAALLLLVLIAAPGYYFYAKHQDTRRRLNELQAQQEDMPTALINKVGRHVLLPEGEQPTIATVTDVSKLSGQPFFARAAKDDKVLVYNQSRRAILYRPSVDKVIEAAPLNTEAAPAVTAPQ